MIWDAIQYIVSALIPPLDADPQHQYRWRLTMAAMMMAVTVSLALHIALVCGRMPFLFSGFATADALSNANKDQAAALNVANLKMDHILQGQISDRILKDRNKECAAIATKPINAAARDYALNDLQGALSDWRQQLGYEYNRLPSCEELGN